MGIKKLSYFLINKILNKNKKGIYKYKSLYDFISKNNCKIFVIDTMFFIYKYKVSLDHFLIGFINQCLNFLSNKIIPIYIFDGEPPIEKINIINNRNDDKYKNYNLIKYISQNFLENCNNINDCTIYDDKIWFLEINRTLSLSILNDKTNAFQLNKSLPNSNSINNHNDKDNIQPPVAKQYPIFTDATTLESNEIMKSVEQLNDDINNVEYSSNNYNNYNSVKTQYSHNNTKIYNSINISDNDIIKIKKLFDLLNVPYFTSINESDALCSAFCKNEEYKNTYCLSNDMDLLAYGCKHLLFKHNGSILLFKLDEILDELELSHSQFIDMCIFFGCDYLKINHNLNVNKIYELIKNKDKDFLNKNITDEFKNVKKIFEDYPSNELKNKKNYINIKTNINSTDLIDFLNYNNLDKFLSIDKINSKINIINSHIDQNKYS